MAYTTDTYFAIWTFDLCLMHFINVELPEMISDENFIWVPQLFGPLSGASILLMSLQHRASKPSNLSILLVFHTLKTRPLKISFWKHLKWFAVWQLAFRDQKIRGTFEKQAPWLVYSVMVPSNHFDSPQKFWTRTCPQIMDSRSLPPLSMLYFWSLCLSKTLPLRSRRIKSNLVINRKIRSNSAGDWPVVLFSVVL